MAIGTFTQCILLVFAVITFCVSNVFGGECCKAYRDITGDLRSPQWCSDLCCINPKTLGGTYYCCENILLQAPNNMRDSFCIQWWAAHLYVPILIGVAVLLIVAVTCCCCCCCCGCCRRQRPGYIVQNQQPDSSVIVQQQSMCSLLYYRFICYSSAAIKHQSRSVPYRI
ncbi:Hypothetical predicted protein [Mytilus galloprovincialis]|uniref:Uncharacterized protein n=1 Tax=Mytilus galloprovincialis TaxID=29158 RepID=A0A8B6HRT2_MYTGA|nr:Hypothetical predicted protein [Mytilus galloprovincialis]